MTSIEAVSPTTPRYYGKYRGVVVNRYRGGLAGVARAAS